MMLLFRRGVPEADSVWFSRVGWQFCFHAADRSCTGQGGMVTLLWTFTFKQSLDIPYVRNGSLLALPLEIHPI